jgi:acyl dehydratase
MQPGTVLPPTTYVLTEERIRAFAAVLGDAALPDPPTLATCFGVWANPAWLNALRELGAPLEHMLHGEEAYTYHAPLRPGPLRAEATIVEVREKSAQSGPITLLTLATRLSDEAGRLCVEGRTVIVVRG